MTRNEIRKMREEMEALVKKGAAFLDQHDPGWWRRGRGEGSGRITIRDLDMSSSKKCVLGQRYGSYRDGILKLQTYRGEDTHEVDWEVGDMYGFEIPDDHLDLVEADSKDPKDQYYWTLGKMWENEIRTRRSNFWRK